MRAELAKARPTRSSVRRCGTSSRRSARGTLSGGSSPKPCTMDATPRRGRPAAAGGGRGAPLDRMPAEWAPELRAASSDDERVVRGVADRDPCLPGRKELGPGRAAAAGAGDAKRSAEVRGAGGVCRLPRGPSGSNRRCSSSSVSCLAKDRPSLLRAYRRRRRSGGRSSTTRSGEASSAPSARRQARSNFPAAGRLRTSRKRRTWARGWLPPWTIARPEEPAGRTTSNRVLGKFRRPCGRRPSRCCSASRRFGEQKAALPSWPALAGGDACAGASCSSATRPPARPATRSRGAAGGSGRTCRRSPRSAPGATCWNRSSSPAPASPAATSPSSSRPTGRRRPIRHRRPRDRRRRTLQRPAVETRIGRWNRRPPPAPSRSCPKGWTCQLGREKLADLLAFLQSLKRARGTFCGARRHSPPDKLGVGEGLRRPTNREPFAVRPGTARSPRWRGSWPA